MISFVQYFLKANHFLHNFKSRSEL